MNLPNSELIKIALNEDIPRGDITTDSLELNDIQGKARLIAKEDLVLSGKELFHETFKAVDERAQLKWQFENGDLILNKQTVCTIEGPLSSLLKAERVALNFLGHLSGIATLTKCFVNKIQHTQCKILDTRKTTPMYRSLEKQAVVHGGGQNHRMNLSDAILIKENHIHLAGSIKEAVNRCIAKGHKYIEVEVKNIDELKLALDAGANHVMLDNMDNDTMAEAIKITPSSVKTEASGNMSLERVQAVAEIGVSYISVGAITHSAPTADYSLLFVDEN